MHSFFFRLVLVSSRPGRSDPRRTVTRWPLRAADAWPALTSAGVGGQIDPLVRSCPTPAWVPEVRRPAGRGGLGLGGQMCGRWCCRRCGSFGKPILNHQDSQHSDILENHICARHTRCIPYPVIPSSPHTHTHYKRHSKRAEKEIELCMFYYLSGAMLYPGPGHCNGVMYISLQPNGLH